MGRKIKTVRSDSAPTVLAAVGLDVSPAPWTVNGGATPHIIDGTHIIVRRRGPNGWGSPKISVTTGWRDTWTFLDSLAASGRRVYVVASRASDALVMLHFWERVKAGEVVLWHKGRGKDKAGKTTGKRHPLVMSGRPDIIGYTVRGSSFRWVSVTNWCYLSLKQMAERAGVPTPPVSDDLDRWEYNKWPASLQSDIISRYMTGLIDWWLANGCGAWRDTPGAAAWSSFLRNSEDCKIVTHEIPEVQRLEDRACVGGRVAAWYFGDVGDADKWGELADSPPPGRKGLGMVGPVHRFDVKAMYPTLLRDQLYPTAFVRRDVPLPGRQLTLHAVRVGIRSLLAVAAVRLLSPTPTTPVRCKGGTAYPTGRVDTVLTTPELLRAMDAGRVERVWDVAWYSPGRPFQQWAEWGLSLRSAAEVGSSPVGKTVVKALLNSLTGRLARRRVRWVDCPSRIPDEDWGTFSENDPDSGKIIKFRSLARHVQREEREDWREGTLAACYAHLTAYGRLWMDDVRAVCGGREVLWQDTDGIIVTTLGSERLKASPYYNPDEYGKLKFERTIHNLRIFTPKHYWADGQWVLAGVNHGFTVDEDAIAHTVQIGNPVRQAMCPDAAAVFRSIRHIDLKGIEPGVSVGPDGWSIPPELWKGEQPAPRPKGQLPLWAEDVDL